MRRTPGNSTGDAGAFGLWLMRGTGDAQGGRDYTAVAMAIQRFATNARTGPRLREAAQAIKQQCEE
jgi:hypothetical protein